MPPPKELEVLITVKAYPNPSAGVGEAACIAGITRDHEHVRLYPIPFRDLEDGKSFNKYQWVTLNVSKPKSDKRPETYRPQIDTIKLGETISTGGDPTWRARRDIVMPAVRDSLCGLQAEQEAKGTSLGLIKPTEVLDVTVEEEAEREWSGKAIAKLGQKDLFLGKDKKILRKVPYKFRYKFRCAGCRSGAKPHEMKIVDWELAQLFWNERSRKGEDEAVESVREKFRDVLCADDRDTHFFVGNMARYHHNFLVLGVFWPKVIKQPSLF